MRGAAFLVLLGGALGLLQDPPSGFDARGRLVCLLEEMKEKHRLEVPPVHEHLLGFKVEGEVPAGGFRWLTILRNRQSEALFADPRFKERELRLRGRVLPQSGLLEVSRWMGCRDGKLQDLYYWCEVCTIRDVDPGPCACCQAKMDFREKPAEEER